MSCTIHTLENMSDYKYLVNFWEKRNVTIITISFIISGSEGSFVRKINKQMKKFMIIAIRNT